MINFKEYLLQESIVNLFNKEDKEEYKEEIFNLLQKAYAKIGGLKGSGFNSPDDMVLNIPMWKIIKRNNNITAVFMYKSKPNRKIVAIATDGTTQGKVDLKNILKDEFKLNRSYIEVSGPLLKFIKVIMGPDYDNIKIPSDTVAKLINNEEIRIINDFEYQRNFKGEWVTKIMLGNINSKVIET